MQSLKHFVTHDDSARKIFGKKEIRIIQKQLDGITLTQSEKNRLSRSVRKKFEVIILRLGPTRAKGVYNPFGELKLHLKIENALQAIQHAIETPKKLWYEPFSIVDEIEGVDISKAKKILDYRPI